MTKFRLEEIERLVEQISKKAHYPIRGPNDLAEALGGKNATVEYEGKYYKASEVDRIPPDMFPIESPNDLVAKVATLRAIGGDEVEGMERGKEG